MLMSHIKPFETRSLKMTYIGVTLVFPTVLILQWYLVKMWPLVESSGVQLVCETNMVS